MSDRDGFSKISCYRLHSIYHCEGAEPYPWVAVHAKRPEGSPFTIFAHSFNGIQREIEIVASSGKPGGRRTA